MVVIEMKANDAMNKLELLAAYVEQIWIYSEGNLHTTINEPQLRVALDAAYKACKDAGITDDEMSNAVDEANND